MLYILLQMLALLEALEMDSHSNDSSSDSDSSPNRDKMEPNQSDSGSQEDTAYGIVPPSKPISETITLNTTRLSIDKLIRTTSISSTNSESMVNFPGKRAPVRETLSFQELDQRDSEGPSEGKRITRSSRRGEVVSSKEATQNQTNKDVKTNKSKKIARKSNRKLRSRFSSHQPEQRESEYSSEGDDARPPLPPLVLMVSIPIENSSVNGEDSPAQSDAASELSESRDTSNLATHHSKGKDIGNLDEEYSSKDSVDNGSSSERSNSVASSQEDSGGEERSKEVPQSSEMTSGDQEDTWKQQDSSRSGEESAADSSNEEAAVSLDKTVGKRNAEKATDNSGKSIPRRRRADTSSPDPTPTVRTATKRVSKRNKVCSGKEGDIRKKIKHIIQLDLEMDSNQLEALLLESYHALRNRDQQAIFCSPVTDDIAPGYSKLITQPMDFSRMKDKISTNEYTRLEQLFDDFLLMCQNAMSYNKPTTYYYRAAKRIKDTGIKTLEKLARSHILAQAKPGTVSPQEQTLIVSIDRSCLSTPLFSSKRASHLSPSKSSQGNESDILSQAVPATESLVNSESTKSKLLEIKSETSLEAEADHPRQTQTSTDTDTDTINADTSLLPPPSSYTQSHSQASPRVQPNPIDRIAESINTRDTPTSTSTKKQPSLMEIKQRKFNKKREQNFQRMYTRASQARRIYGGSLAPVRPLSYGSFASFAPNYDSSFANINRQETDIVYSILEQREQRECEDSMLYTSCDSEVSPYYLRLADGILNLDRDKSILEMSRRTERNSEFSQDLIRMNIMKKHVGLSGRMQQQFDEMLQQSAELIASLNQKQGRDELDQEQGAGLGEELNKISKILMTIGAAIKTNESS